MQEITNDVIERAKKGSSADIEYIFARFKGSVASCAAKLRTEFFDQAVGVATTDACAKVVNYKTGVCPQLFKCRNVTQGKVGNMDIISDTCAVFCVIIIAENTN